MAILKNHIKLIASLQQKKYRERHCLFVAEGVKVVTELLKSHFIVEKVFTTVNFPFDISLKKINLISDDELKKISQLKSPNKVLGLFKIPSETLPKPSKLTVALDGINDPGNLGTIIRLCDWFGVHQLICSKKTVDCYNQKVVQSSMGSLARVQINYVNLPLFLSTVKMPIFFANMNGKNVYETHLPKEAILIMGNEANGISSEIIKLSKNNIAIPRFGNIQQTESLNVATATAILISEFKRS